MMTEDDGIGGDLAFGRFRLDVKGGVLLRDGQPVQLRPRALEILRVLAAAQGRLVAKDELMSRVWPGAIVEDNSLQVHISALRKALGEDVDGRRFILTVPGRGYRLIPNTAAAAAPTLPNKPSIAVMPFQNLSDDPGQDYFADGIVEDIITALSRIRWLFVIARNSSFTYKGRPVDIRQVSRELGVRYALEGSVRKSGKRIRITGQLIDATTGTHLWADRFDGSLSDIFDLQDEVAANVAGAIAPKLEQAEIERAGRKRTENLDAYDYYLRGLASFHRETRESNCEALRHFYKAIELDQDFASAHGMAAWCFSQRTRDGWVTDWSQERAETKRLALRAAELGKDDALALCVAGNALALVVHDLDAGTALIDRAIQLNPNLAIAWYCSAWVRVWLGEPELAIKHAERAMRLSPLDPLLHGMEAAIALAHFIAGRYDAAASWAEKSFHKHGNFQATIRILAASHALAGRLAEAQTAMARMREVNPALRVQDIEDLVPLRRTNDFARYAEGLRMAGLPE